MNVEQNKKIVCQLLADISAWNIDAAIDALTDDATWWVAGDGQGLTMNKTQMAETFRLLSTTVLPTGLNVTVDNVIGEGDFVAAEGRSNATLANGGNYQNRYHWMFELRDGKVCRAREYLDTLVMKQASGAMVAP